MSVTPDVTQRQLHAFVVLADELHFGRAAARLHVSQPALSLAIQQLEKSLGVALLARSTRSVSLTPAGADFLAKIGPALNAVDMALDSARRWAEGTRGLLRLGYLIGAGLDRLPRLLREFADAYPEIRVETVEYDFAHPTAGLGSGDVDLALVRPPIEVKGARYLEISQEGWVACLPSNHRYAQRRSIKVRDILREPIVAAPKSAGGWRDYWLASEFRDQQPAEVVAEAATFEAEFTAVAQGKGISITSETASRYYLRPGVVFVPIADAPPCSVSLAWPRVGASPAALRFVKLARDGLDS
ncbi:MAG TPA: LysR family transcriptional regulator [Candidatus Nanopelagicales bacterium]|nr:LysR family transcriptional regulator [Candidatus Nanopelagicales bacterium]